jgi:hypothetical protein
MVAVATRYRIVLANPPVGIARRVGAQRRAKQKRYRPALTHSSRVNIKPG